jgi:glycogen synthase
MQRMSSCMPTATCLKKNELDLGTLFFAQGGVIYSNAVVTVSPSYAHDIVHAGAGSFLREVFNLPHVSAEG